MRSNHCLGLYHCNAWDCKRCQQRKLFWLREQCLNFVRNLAFSDLYFITLKPFQNAEICSAAIRSALLSLKSQKSPCSAKLEYIAIISNHGFSSWHAHIISTRFLGGKNVHCEKVRNKKHAALYLVANLERSASSDYAKVRRYQASSLLYKQSAKSFFKTRIRLWRIKTLLIRLERMKKFVELAFERSSLIGDNVLVLRNVSRRVPTPPPKLYPKVTIG